MSDVPPTTKAEMVRCGEHAFNSNLVEEKRRAIPELFRSIPAANSTTMTGPAA
jgi:hypothetical protein